MSSSTTSTPAEGDCLFDGWFDPIEAGLRTRVRGFIETLLEEELTAVLSRPRYGRQADAPADADHGSHVPGHRHGHRTRQLTGSFGPTAIAVPRARLTEPNGTTREWKSAALRSYQRRTAAADALIASAYLAGTNTCRVRRALAAVFTDGVGKDVVSRVWRKVKTDWEAWNRRDLAAEPIVRLILDGTVVRVRLDRKATAISLLVVIGVREDGQKVLLAVKNMGGETADAWRVVLDDLIGRGLRRPDFLIVDGGTGLDKALAALWTDVPTQRCTVHKHRNLLAHAPEKLRDEVTADYRDMIYAETTAEIMARRRAFVPQVAAASPARGRQPGGSGTVRDSVRRAVSHQKTKRSPKTTANCVFASTHSRGGRFQSAAAWLSTRYNSFKAASSFGKCPRVRTARRNFAFSASMALVV